MMPCLPRAWSPWCKHGNNKNLCPWCEEERNRPPFPGQRHHPMMNIFQAIALGGSTAAKGLEEAVGVVQAMAAAFDDIPDAPEVRKALDVWGITWAAYNGMENR